MSFGKEWIQINNPDQGVDVSFTDVGADAWYAKAVAWAANAGIVNGYPDGSFGADDTITREQLLVMLYRYAGNPGIAAAGLQILDAGMVSPYAVQAVNWAIETGIISVSDNTAVRPQDDATREEAAQIIWNFMQK